MGCAKVQGAGMGNTGSVLRVRCWKCGELAGKVGRLAGKISARLAAHTRSRAAGWAADSQRCFGLSSFMAAEMMPLPFSRKLVNFDQDQDARFNCILVAGGEEGAGCCGFTNSVSWVAKISSIAVRSAPDLALSMTRRIPWRSASPITAEQYMVNITIGVLGRRFLMEKDIDLELA